MNRIKAKDIPTVKAQLLLKQGGICPLCKTDMNFMEPKNRVVDHCHTTGVVRAVLCRNCNQMEGKIKNLANRAKRTGSVPGWLGRLLVYWALHRTAQTNLIHPTHKTDDEKRLARNAAARKRRAAAKR